MSFKTLLTFASSFSFPAEISRRPRSASPLRSNWTSCARHRISQPDAASLVATAASALQPAFQRIDFGTQRRLSRVLSALHAERIGAQHFAGVDGYGHGDLGRDALDAVYARIFSCEAALVRVQFQSGTHAIAAALFGVLRPGDEVVSAAGDVYDTLQEVLGIREGNTVDPGSLKDWGVSFRSHPLRADGVPDVTGLVESLTDRTRVVLIQRSFGYAWRPALRLDDIARIVREVKRRYPRCVCFVDNCYGEFVEDREPVHPEIGADLMAGSLIKNLGGGIAPCGGYVAGRKELVERARMRLSAPGVGGGASLGCNRVLFQGLFMSPGIIGESLKGAMLVGEVMARLGYETNPPRGEVGFVCSVKLETRERLIEFCKAVQRNGPVGAYIEPVAGVTEGYGDDVVFAQSTFIDGSTIELSADGPVREPFVVFAQGGFHWTHWAIVLEDVVKCVGKKDDQERVRLLTMEAETVDFRMHTSIAC